MSEQILIIAMCALVGFSTMLGSVLRGLVWLGIVAACLGSWWAVAVIIHLMMP